MKVTTLAYNYYNIQLELIRLDNINEKCFEVGSPLLICYRNYILSSVSFFRESPTKKGSCCQIYSKVCAITYKFSVIESLIKFSELLNE
jgi:hypothetical protein